MKTLILHASVGGGHRSAALALVEAFRELDPEGAVEARDVLEFTPAFFRRLYAEGYSWLADNPLHHIYAAMIVAAGLLALASVPEVFVVLWARQAGMDVRWVPLVWAAASLVKMGIAMPAGIFSSPVFSAE